MTSTTDAGQSLPSGDSPCHTEYLDKPICSGIQEHMQKQSGYLLAFLLFFGIVPGIAYAIDGDFGNPYASGQQSPAAPRAPGEAPVYGGRDAPVPLATLIGGVLVVTGAAAAGWWQRKSVRMSRRPG